MCWLLVLLECFTVQDFESKFFIRVTPSHARVLKFVGFYFRDVYEFLFTRRYVTARILAEESLEGQEVVFAVTTVCLVLRTAIVVQNGNLARTEKRCLQMLKQLLLDFLAVLLTDIKPQQPCLEKKLG